MYVQALASKRYQEAPLYRERAAFLDYRLSIGINHRVVRSSAATLLHVVRVLGLNQARSVSRTEVHDGGRVYAADTALHGYRKAGPWSYKVFTRTALLFLEHNHLLLAESPHRPFATQLDQYLNMLKEQRGLQPNTIAGSKGHLLRFFNWVAPRRQNALNNVAAPDLINYLTERVRAGSEGYAAIVHGVLRSFFKYSAEQGWVDADICNFLEDRRWSASKPKSPYTPSWRKVRLLIADSGDGNSRSVRAKAIMLLCSIYGLRASEVAGLSLCDFNWEERTISFRRSKSGISQCMPLRFEVGDAVLSYISQVRPQCSCECLFITFQRPYRPMRAPNLSLVVRRCMIDSGLQFIRLGTHSLRHACATQMLKSGSSLREIADFLGHRDLSSVSIYVQCDEEALRQVAAFSIASVI